MPDHLLPEESLTVRMIYKWHEDRNDRGEPHHGRLGASQIGRPCDRQLWYSFRGLYKSTFPGRILRLFETGHLEEPRFVKELQGIGCTIYEKDEETEKQFEFTAIGGHFVCHPDAVAIGVPEAKKTWHICEFKTMGGTEDQKSKDFEKCKKDGVKSAKPEHYAQMMVGMGLSKCKRALYLTKKKATDELYSERVRYDANEFKRIMDRAERIIRLAQPPERITDRPDNWQCRFCDAKQLCWAISESSDPPVPLHKKTCRSCCHATPLFDGDAKWICSYHNQETTFEEQQLDCSDHLLLPGLVGFADPVDSGENWIEFKNRESNAIWRHGNGEGMFSTDQLIAKGEVT